MRTKIVKVADKDILIQEKTIGEIKKIVKNKGLDVTNYKNIIERCKKNDNL